MSGQDILVNRLVAEGVVRHTDVEQALRRVDRGKFIGADMPGHYAYQDTPLPIGHGETISAPHMHATCLELLRAHLKPGARVLDVGSGSGYLAAAMGVMVGTTGRVMGVEKHPQLAEWSIRNVKASNPELLEQGVVQLRPGNVLGDALAGEQAFDAIHVGAAAERLPAVLVEKLKPGGRMVVPVGPHWQSQVLQVVDKDEAGKVHRRNLMAVSYVPLTEPGGEE